MSISDVLEAQAGVSDEWIIEQANKAAAAITPTYTYRCWTNAQLVLALFLLEQEGVLVTGIKRSPMLIGPDYVDITYSATFNVMTRAEKRGVEILEELNARESRP